MKLDTLYIVTYPNKHDTLPDILYEIGKEFITIFPPTLTIEIEGIYSDPEEAEQAARQLLRERDEEMRQVGLIKQHIQKG